MEATFQPEKHEDRQGRGHIAIQLGSEIFLWRGSHFKFWEGENDTVCEEKL